MIPRLRANGTLPPGIHQATLAEILATYAPRNQQRHILNDSLRRVVVELQHLDPTLIIYVDGSYVTKKAEPNDVDVLIITDRFTEPEIQHYLDQVCPVEAVALDVTVEPSLPNSVFTIFTTTQGGQAKGIIQLD